MQKVRENIYFVASVRLGKRDPDMLPDERDIKGAASGIVRLHSEYRYPDRYTQPYMSSRNCSIGTELRII